MAYQSGEIQGPLQTSLAILLELGVAWGWEDRH
jgi:hypothetical protein